MDAYIFVDRLCMSYSLLPSVNKARRLTSEKVWFFFSG